MNTPTQQVIELLTHPELPFGTEEDVLMMSDPATLQKRVEELLQGFPAVLGHEKTAALQTRLSEADWTFIAREFRARVEITASFFDADADAHKSAKS